MTDLERQWGKIAMKSPAPEGTREAFYALTDAYYRFDRLNPQFERDLFPLIREIRQSIGALQSYLDRNYIWD